LYTSSCLPLEAAAQKAITAAHSILRLQATSTCVLLLLLLLLLLHRTLLRYLCIHHK